MYGRVPAKLIHHIAITVAGLGFLTACSQMPKHSNTLVFGTNTTLGLNVGVDDSKIPTVLIGYDRQEFALVPVWANIGVGEKGDLTPCDPTVNTKEYDCRLFAQSSETDIDAFSVIASFGGKATGGDEGGSMAVAQYFATGIAAQKLAANGGANILSAGGNSKANAEAVVAAADAEAEREKTKQLTIMSRAEEISQIKNTNLIKIANDVDDGSGNVAPDKLAMVKAKLGIPDAIDLSVYANKPIKELTDRLNNDFPIEVSRY